MRAIMMVVLVLVMVVVGCGITVSDPVEVGGAAGETSEPWRPGKTPDLERSPPPKGGQ